MREGDHQDQPDNTPAWGERGASTHAVLCLVQTGGQWVKRYVNIECYQLPKNESFYVIVSLEKTRSLNTWWNSSPKPNGEIWWNRGYSQMWCNWKQYPTLTCLLQFANLVKLGALPWLLWHGSFCQAGRQGPPGKAWITQKVYKYNPCRPENFRALPALKGETAKNSYHFWTNLE